MTQQEINKLASNCSSCTKDCALRPIILYIQKIGFDHFEYQLKNHTLPKQVQFAIEQIAVLTLVTEKFVLELLEKHFCN